MVLGELMRICQEGIEERYPEGTGECQDRIRTMLFLELGYLRNLGFVRCA